MPKTATIHVRVEPALKREAEETLSALGLSVSEAISLLYEQVAMHGGLSFLLRVPNAATLEALQELRSGEGTTEYAGLDELMAEFEPD